MLTDIGRCQVLAAQKQQNSIILFPEKLELKFQIFKFEY